MTNAKKCDDWAAVGYSGLLCSSPEDCKLVAVHDGCGESATWTLCVEDSDGEVVAYLKWPKAWPQSMTCEKLLAAGFECITA